MEHKGTQCLKSERLILRPFTLKDAQAMFTNWASDEEVTKYLTWPVHTQKSNSEQVLREWVNNYKKRDYYQWAIVFKQLFSRQNTG